LLSGKKNSGIIYRENKFWRMMQDMVQEVIALSKLVSPVSSSPTHQHKSNKAPIKQNLEYV